VVAVVTKLARGGRGCAPQVANPRFCTAAQQESTCGAGPVFFIDRASGTNLALRYDFTFCATTAPEPAAAVLIRC